LKGLCGKVWRIPPRSHGELASQSRDQVVGLDIETLNVDSFGGQLFCDLLEVLDRKNEMFELRSVSVTNDSLKHSLGAAFAARSVDNAADSDRFHAAPSSRGDVVLSAAVPVGRFAMLDAEQSFDLC